MNFCNLFLTKYEYNLENYHRFSNVFFRTKISWIIFNARQWSRTMSQYSTNRTSPMETLLEKQISVKRKKKASYFRNCLKIFWPLFVLDANKCLQTRSVKTNSYHNVWKTITKGVIIMKPMASSGFSPVLFLTCNHSTGTVTLSVFEWLNYSISLLGCWWSYCCVTAQNETFLPQCQQVKWVISKSILTCTRLYPRTCTFTHKTFISR